MSPLLLSLLLVINLSNGKKIASLTYKFYMQYSQPYKDPQGYLDSALFNCSIYYNKTFNLNPSMICVPLESPSEDASHFFSRIVGGEVAPKGFAPHMAALVISDVIKMFTCGGSIISNRHVLTAAHCIDMFVISGQLLPTFHAIVGTNDWYNKGIEARIAEFHIHPQWDPQPIKYDIGILVLKKELEMSNRIGVIALNFNWVGGGEDSYVTGWGRLDAWGIIPYKLQLLFVRTLSQEECMKLLLKVPGADTYPPNLKKEIEICAFHSIQHGLCYGDSGSALVHKKSNQQIGITSWAYPCARGFPDVFVRISAFKDYIMFILNKKIGS